MITATLHGGPRDGETVEMPWARIEILFPRFESLAGALLGVPGEVPDFEAVADDLYKLRGPWRGQEWADYDYVTEEERQATDWRKRHKTRTLARVSIGPYTLSLIKRTT